MTELVAARSQDELLEAVVAHYELCLPSAKKAVRLLDRLGAGEELRSRCRLGYSDRTFGKRLPMTKLAEGRAVRGVLREVGVLRASGHEHFRGMLFVPVFDDEDRLVQAYGYRLRKGVAAEDETANLTTSPAVWRADDARPGPEVVLATDPLVGLALVAAGIEHVQAWVGGDAGLSDGVERAKLVGLESQATEVERLEQLVRASGVEVSTCRVPGKLGDCRGLHLAELVRDNDDRGGAERPVERTRPVANEPEAESTLEPVLEAARELASRAKTPSEVPGPIDEFTYTFSDRSWRVRGLEANRARGTLRLNVMVRRDDGPFHLDALDLCVARQRHAFVRAAAGELDVPEPVLKRDLGKVLLALEEAQDLMLARLEQPKSDVPIMSEARRGAALGLLKSPDLLERMLVDLDALGVVGERDNLLVLLFTVVSRILKHPLAVVVQSTPAAGKSNLVQTALSLVPEERRHVYTAITGQSLYYMGCTDLRHGVLCLAEEAGVGKAAYALKLLQSDGHLTIATTAKDPDTGRLRAQRYQVEGPVALVMTTTAFDLDPELLSRAIVLTVDESASQTARIHARQRRAHTLEGLRDVARRASLLELHQDVQRLLEPLRVVCPVELLDCYDDLRVRARRDHRKLLSLVEAVALLHQFQRQREAVEVDGARVEYVTATAEDVDLALRLLDGVTPGIDELPRHTAGVLRRVVGFVKVRAAELELRPKEVRFRRRELAARVPLSPSQLKLHLGRLVDAELLLRHGTGDGGVAYSVRIFQYEAGGPGGGRRGAGPAETVESEVIPEGCSEGGRSGPNARGPQHDQRRTRTGSGPMRAPKEQS